MSYTTSCLVPGYVSTCYPGADAASESSESDSDGEDASAGAPARPAATGLPSLFAVGQYVSCVVLNNSAASTGSVFSRLVAGGDGAAASKKGKVGGHTPLAARRCD